jgi:ketosteroid isomerase-like protein
VSSDDLELAGRFRAALETAVRTGDHETLLGLVTRDVEWVTPQRTLHGIDELRAWRVWGSSAESFDFEFRHGEWVDQGSGRVACDVEQVYRMKETGDFAYERRRRVELTIRDGQVRRYELLFTG